MKLLSRNRLYRGGGGPLLLGSGQNYDPIIAVQQTLSTKNRVACRWVHVRASWQCKLKITDPKLDARLRCHSVDSRLSRLVLDTNIVLDCLVFRDPATFELTAAIEARRVHALVHEYALAELQRVLTYAQCRLTAIEQRQVLDRYLAATTLVTMPDGFNSRTLLLPTAFPRCRDHDDGPFLALAYHAQADGLVTKDKAILKLQRKARRFGVAILAPADLQLLQL